MELGHTVIAQIPPNVPESLSLIQMKEQGVEIVRPHRPNRRGFGGKLKRVAERLGLKNPDSVWSDLERFFDLNIVSQGNLPEGLPLIEQLCRQRQSIIVVVQLVSEFQWPSDDVGLRLRTALSSVKSVCFVSQNNRILAEQQLGPLPNAAVVRNPFLVPYENQLTYPSSDSGFRVGTVARLHAYHKGFDLFIQVIDQDKWRNRGIEFHLFGDGPHRESLERDVQRRGLERKIIFRGHHNDVTAIWRECHAFLLCSRIEGLPLSLVEAMLSGRCPIVTNVGGAAELVEDGANGFLAQFATVRDIDDALERAWQRRDAWREIGNLAASSVKARVPADPADVFADQLIELLSTK